MIVSYKTHAPSRVIDANGLEWSGMRWVDTETGEGEQVVTDENGIKQVDLVAKCVRTRQVRLAAPVLVVPVNPLYDTKEKWEAALREAEREISEREMPHPVVWPKCREAVE